jgi:hypothetical protein
MPDGKEAEMFLSGRGIAAGALGVALSGAVAPVESQTLDRDGALKLNQIQVIRTHNSYHAGIPPNEAKLWEMKDPDVFRGLTTSTKLSRANSIAACARSSSISSPIARAAASRIPRGHAW